MIKGEQASDESLYCGLSIAHTVESQAYNMRSEMYHGDLRIHSHRMRSLPVVLSSVASLTKISPSRDTNHHVHSYIGASHFYNSSTQVLRIWGWCNGGPRTLDALC